MTIVDEALTDLYCRENQLSSLDVSNNTALTDLRCGNNQLTCLNLKNGTSCCKSSLAVAFGNT